MNRAPWDDSDDVPIWEGDTLVTPTGRTVTVRYSLGPDPLHRPAMHNRWWVDTGRSGKPWHRLDTALLFGELRHVRQPE